MSENKVKRPHGKTLKNGNRIRYAPLSDCRSLQGTTVRSFIFGAKLVRELRGGCVNFTLPENSRHRVAKTRHICSHSISVDSNRFEPPWNVEETERKEINLSPSPNKKWLGLNECRHWQYFIFRKETLEIELPESYYLKIGHSNLNQWNIQVFIAYHNQALNSIKIL